MKTVLIGDMERIDRLYNWLQRAKEIFEVELIISENETESQYYVCPVETLNELGKVIRGRYDIIFICSAYYKEIRDILLACSENDMILSEEKICQYLGKADIMRYYYECFQSRQKPLDTRYVQLGDFSYCNGKISTFNDKTKLIIGKFSSIAAGTNIMLGGEHRTDWCTTYPFNEIVREFSYIEGHPKSKGDIIIGNDVWIGSDSKILSGVHIGNGSVVAANAVVTKDVEPYAIVGGNPAKIIRKRFDDQTIQRLEEIQWWNWDYERIYDAVPILQSGRIDQLFDYYDSVIKKKEAGI